MKGLIIANEGVEDISALEIKELLNLDDVDIRKKAVLFEIKKLKDLAFLCYRAQSPKRIIHLLGETRVSDNLEDTIKNFEKILNYKELADYIDNKVIRVDCERIGKHDFKSIDISKNIADYLIKKGYNNISFKNPDIIIYVFINNKKAYIGIDFSGDISKRYYKIFNNSKSIKGNTAYCLLRKAEYSKGKTLIDPFCRSGEITIEAALFSHEMVVQNKFPFLKFLDFGLSKEIPGKKSNEKISIYGYDSMERNIIAARKNSKIAMVDKLINLNKADLSWIETRHDKESVDCIVTRLPETSKYKKEEAICKVYKEFFEKSYKILNKNGKIALISKNVELIKKEKGKLKIVKELIIQSGKSELKAVILENAM